MENETPKKKSANTLLIIISVAFAITAFLSFFVWKQYQEYRINILMQEGTTLEAEGKYHNAFDKYKRAAEIGSADGQFNLAFLYSNGLGVAKNETLAFDFYKKSAEQGDKQAQIVLSVLYSTGRGVETDPEKAEYWQTKVKEQEESESIDLLN